MTTTARVCVGALAHRPRYHEVDAHHVWPNYAADLLGVPRSTTRVNLCSGCHDVVHHLIHHLINDGTVNNHHTASGVTELARLAYSRWTASLGGTA